MKQSVQVRIAMGKVKHLHSYTTVFLVLVVVSKTKLNTKASRQLYSSLKPNKKMGTYISPYNFLLGYGGSKKSNFCKIHPSSFIRFGIHK